MLVRNMNIMTGFVGLSLAALVVLGAGAASSHLDSFCNTGSGVVTFGTPPPLSCTFWCPEGALPEVAVKGILVEIYASCNGYGTVVCNTSVDPSDLSRLTECNKTATQAAHASWGYCEVRPVAGIGVVTAGTCTV